MAQSESTPPTTPPTKSNKSRRRLSFKSFTRSSRPSSMVSVTPDARNTGMADSILHFITPKNDAQPSTFPPVGAPPAPIASNAQFKFAIVGASASTSAPIARGAPSSSAPMGCSPSKFSLVATDAPFNTAPVGASSSTSAPMAMLAPSNSDDAIPTSQLERIESQLSAQMDMLELLPQRIQTRKLSKDLCEQKAQIFELERVSASAVEGLPQLEMKYTSLKLKYNQQVDDCREKERVVLALMQDSAHLSPMENLKVRRAELEVVEMKPDILRRSIELEEMEIIIHEKKSKSNAAEDQIKVLRRGVEENQEMLAKLEKELKAYNFKFTPYVPRAGQTIDNLTLSLETAVKVLSERLDQVELVLEAATEIKNGGSTEEVGNSANQPHRLRKTRSTLIRELEEAKARNEHLIPLFLVGLSVRAKRAEHLASTKGYRKAEDKVLATGTSAALDADAVADATLNLDHGHEEGERNLYRQLYDLEPQVVWEHREFNMFIEMVNMGIDMEEWSHQDNEAFFNNYDKVYKAILPCFKISSDEELKADPELSRAYNLMERAYKKTAHELRKQPSQSSGSMDGNGARLD